MPLPKPSRMQTDIYVSWCRIYPEWEDSVRRFVAEARSIGLTAFVIEPMHSKHQPGLGMVTIDAREPGTPYQAWR